MFVTLRKANLHEAWNQLCQVPSPATSSTWNVSFTPTFGAKDSQTARYMEVFLDKRFKENHQRVLASGANLNWFQMCKYLKFWDAAAFPCQMFLHISTFILFYLYLYAALAPQVFLLRFTNLVGQILRGSTMWRCRKMEAASWIFESRMVQLRVPWILVRCVWKAYCGLLAFAAIWIVRIWKNNGW